MSYVLRDVVVVLGLAAAATRIESWLVWPLYWAAQGTMFWALFVLGHDCGHGSFSNNAKLNTVVDHILHSSILVPYHGWRISHRTHHQNHGHVEKDESWHPLPQRLYNSLDNMTRKLRFTMPFPMLAFPLYLFARSPGKSGSHFNPNSHLFQSNEKKDVLTSTASWLAMVGVLAGLTFVIGPLKMLKLYAVPYLIFVMWLDFVTYLHHHGHEDKLPWYRGKARPAVIDALSMVDLSGRTGIVSESSPGIFLQGLLVYGLEGREIYKRNLDQEVCRGAFLYSLEHKVPLVAFSHDQCFSMFDDPLVDSLHYIYHEPKVLQDSERIKEYGIHKVVRLAEIQLNDQHPASKEAAH